MGWQDALKIYALFGLLSALLLRRFPRQRFTVKPKACTQVSPHDRRNGWLYATFIALITFVSNGTSTHLPEFIASFGLPVAVGMLWGMGQTGARLMEVLAGGAPHSAKTDAFHCARHAALFSHRTEQRHAGLVCRRICVRLGAINGLVTIVKATLPLELFSTERYASRTGLLLIPGQLMAAASPFAYAWLNKSLGITGGMWVSAGLTLVIAGFAVALVRSPGKQTVSHCIPSATLTNRYKTPAEANIPDT